MINSQDIKNGVCIRMDGRLYFVIEFLHVKPGKGNTIMRVKFKDVVDGRVLERRFNIGEKLEDVRVERRPYQFLYKEGADYIFMNNETFEQVPIAHDLITGVDFLKEGMTCDVVSDASTDTIPDHLHRAGPQGRHRHEHPEARYAGDRRRDPRAVVHQRRRDRPRGHP